MNVLLFKPWIVNVGDGFIGMGAHEVIRQALPNANIYSSSGFSQMAANWVAAGQAANFSGPFGLGKKFEWKRRNESDIPSKFANMSEFVDVDLAVLPGCVLYPNVYEMYKPALKKLKREGSKIVLLGVGSQSYSQSTKKYIVNELEDLEPEAIIMRNKNGYEEYKNELNDVFLGVDCVFFIDDAHEPLDSDRKFITATFDRTEEPSFSSTYDVVRPNHNPFGYTKPFSSDLKNFIKRHISKFEKHNTFVSDRLEDYLFLYKNTEETHSDRLHACIPTLTYGGKAKHYYDTPRAGTVNHLVEGDFNNELTTIDDEKLERMKNKQVDVLSDVL